MRKILSPKEKADIQQPLKDGYANPNFNKLYGKKNNPWTGTERDVDRTHSKSISLNISQERWNEIFKK